MNPILFAIPVFLAFIALEAWLAWRRGLKVYRLHDALTSINIGAMSETIRALLKLLSMPFMPSWWSGLGLQLGHQEPLGLGAGVLHVRLLLLLGAPQRP
ncbi:MAG: hypothetical protein EBQ71_07250 [Betaproteobacteria bacterium]|nr:hypothetical protein [Betaproteobacteria bacterium]